ncbi:hypothetical protein [Nonomuraea sp. NPDC050643]|uniref:hypothetical protein n=1 Tax=Nonomuraea sp. NPDC050643 TaxID=3155660 RepID=UPI0033F993AE
MHTIRQRKQPPTVPAPPWRPSWNSWNMLLAAADALAVRAGWAGRRTGQGRAMSWVLAARPSAVSCARRITTARLTAWGLAGQAAAAELLAGGLVGEALHGGTATVRLTLAMEDGLLRGEVEHGRAWDRAPDPGPLARLACCWGIAGPVAWFELPAGPA